MAELQPRYSMEEFARRGDDIYDRDIHPNITASDEGKFVLIDIETGDYEIDADEIAASDRLLARHPDAQVWMTLAGSRYAHRFGLRYAHVPVTQSASALRTASARMQRFSNSGAGSNRVP